MTHGSPTIYRTRSWTNRRRALTALGGAGLLLLGYGIGRWQDTPAPQAGPPAATSPTATQPAAAPPAATPPASPPAVEATTATPTPDPVEYPVLQVEDADDLHGVETQGTEDEGGGENVGWVSRGDYLRFDDVEFGEAPATKLLARIASGSDAGGRLDIRLDALENTPIGTLAIGNTGGWQSWRTVAAALTPVTGTHTVFVTFTREDDAEFANVNWMKFEH